MMAWCDVMWRECGGLKEVGYDVLEEDQFNSQDHHRNREIIRNLKTKLKREFN